MKHEEFVETYREFVKLRDGIIGQFRLNKKLSGSKYINTDKAITIVRLYFSDYRPTDIPPSLIAKRELLKLPIEERRKILEKQAEELAAYYEQNRDIDGMGGDFEKEDELEEFGEGELP